MEFKDLVKKVAQTIIKKYLGKYILVIKIVLAAIAVLLVIILCIGGVAFDASANLSDNNNSASGTSNANGMESASMSTSSEEQFVRYLHLMEGGGTIYQNDEGVDCYKVISDGSPTGAAVGYGVDIGVHGEELRNRGYSTTIGSLIPVTVVDEIEQRERQENIEDIQERLDANGIELEEYQFYALLSRVYNCGLGGITNSGGAENLNFVQYYTRYWNQERDGRYGQDAADYEHILYTQYMDVPITSQGVVLSGLEMRRESEWILFQTGRYTYYSEMNELWQESYTQEQGSFNNINLYNADRTVSEDSIAELQEALQREFNLHTPGVKFEQYDREICEKVTGDYLGFDHFSGNKPIAHNGGFVYQCPWWATGRASWHLGSNVSIGGNGRDIYTNAAGFAKGSVPKPNSLVSYDKVYVNNTNQRASEYGHVAYVEAVDNINGYYYISHAGGGKAWYGVQKVKIDQSSIENWLWNNGTTAYKILGFVYLDEPLN